MAFQFGFGLADPDENGDDGAESHPKALAQSSAEPHAAESVVTVQPHKLEDVVGQRILPRIITTFQEEESAGSPQAIMRPPPRPRLLLATLPERISYSTVRVESPLGRIVYLPRRELYDARVQLLVEDQGNDAVIDQLENSDIRAGVYEGGFKTWECSLDLASLLLDRGPRKDIDELVRCDQIIELGAGTALPTLVLFQHVLTNSLPSLTFTLADYNEEVLRLVTVPNLLLTWAASLDDSDALGLSLHTPSKGDLDVTPILIERFLSQLNELSCTINLLSGSWSPSLADLIPSSASDMGTVVLAAETIYSPASTKAFVELLAILLKRVKMAKAMIGAKRMYFGVGGSVDGFKEACRDQGAVAYEIENHGVPGMDGGVGRALIEVQMY